MIRQYALTYKELSARLKEIEGKFTDVYEAINYLLNKDKLQTEQNQRKQIGYKTNNDQWSVSFIFSIFKAVWSLVEILLHHHIITPFFKHYELNELTNGPPAYTK